MRPPSVRNWFGCGLIFDIVLFLVKPLNMWRFKYCAEYLMRGVATLATLFYKLFLLLSLYFFKMSGKSGKSGK